MACHLCNEDLEHCHEVSIDHVDGTTECGGDVPCSVAHQLHVWQVSCAEFDVPCSCEAADLDLAA